VRLGFWSGAHRDERNRGKKSKLEREREGTAGGEAFLSSREQRQASGEDGGIGRPWQ
jgi:hypothetical protein